jgi:N-acetylmuramoyl-L-alanine amidase
MRFLRVLSAAMLVWALAAPAFSAAGVKSKQQVARNQFQKAQRMREALNGRPAAERSRREYEKVVDAYRRVYYTSPTSSQASTSVVAVAELLAESGRAFRDEKLLRAAIGQYEFLRREYPGSKYRFEALFTIGQIYKDDLEDAGQARASFEEFLKRYPRNHLADDARQAIADLDRQAREPETRAEKKAAPLPLVTGIRHWSAPDYTRVAIDLEGDVKYDADRIPDPDRIFFDLHDTRLSSTLVGKTFDVDDGFLRKIRVAQYQRGETRVVLEVGEVADYTAFMLPNPYRLVVDIHGKRPQKLQAGKPGADKAGAQEPGEAAQSRPPRKNGATGENRPVEVAKAEVKPAPPGGKPTLLPEDAARLKATEAHPDAASSAAPDKAARTESKPPAPEAKSKSSQGAKTAGGREANPTSNGERSLIRALGLKIGRIVVDAGHGGHDTGTIGPNGLREKDLTLDVALRLGKLLESRLGAEVIYTRIPAASARCGAWKPTT